MRRPPLPDVLLVTSVIRMQWLTTDGCSNVLHRRLISSSRASSSTLPTSTIFRRHFALSSSRHYAMMSSLPRVAQPSIWQSIIPKFLRNPNNPPSPEKIRRTKEWNPAIFFIVMFLLIGSNAMHMIALRNEYTAFSRRADAKIGLLKDVIERVQRGEDVDVKGLLGTGNPEKERAWEEGKSQR